MINGQPHFSEYDEQFDHGIVVLSYEGIEIVYQDLANEFSKFAISLDLTENEITDLSFLKSFNKLQSLVLDKNRHLNPKTMPTMKSLQILWLNSCNIPDITKWVEVIRVRCPKLRCLSMINNPGTRSLVNYSKSEENQAYRAYVAGKLKSLEYLDEAPVVRGGGTLEKGGRFLSKLFHFNNYSHSPKKGGVNVSINEENEEEHRRLELSHDMEEVMEKAPWWSHMH